ncbi:hypothetical protein SASPL_107968 [Salvia splendens]|uniref:MADS-box domain-containing protein n=1 Tax=Salvia splendens TaxID=180675 RepID=A0A8X9A701_SALSN|nr:hypothetical protein SASPL_107968 [Salvia splendens]
MAESVELLRLGLHQNRDFRTAEDGEFGGFAEEPAAALALEDKTASEGQPIDTHPLLVYWRGGRKATAASSKNGEFQQHKTLGRRKIPMRKIENKSSLQVACTKRRGGLFRKATKLSILCGAEVAILVQS